MNPLILYSPDGKRTRRVYQIDAPGWINAGWTTEPPSTKEQELDALTPTPDIDECESRICRGNIPPTEVARNSPDRIFCPESFALNAEEQAIELPPQETRAPKTKAAK